MGIQLNGLEGIVERLEKYEDVQKFEAQLKKACALVERAAKEKAPKGTGELRRSITSEIKQEGDNLMGVVYTPLEYAPYVEFGTGLFAEEGGRTDVPWRYQNGKGEWYTTSGQHPQPFMRPAFNENREEILRILREALKE